jgi:hypothetical protein
MTRTPLRMLLAGSLLLVACGDDGQNEPGTGTFAADMTGAYTAVLSGQAQFGVTLDDGFRAAGLALVLGDSSAARIFLVSSATPRPLAGTYAIVAPGLPATSDTVFTGTLGYVANGALQGFEIRAGTITLTRSAQNGVAGTFELAAVRTSPCCDPAPVQVVIAGTFDAAQFPQVF